VSQRVTPLVCSSYSSLAPLSTFFSSWWQLFTHTLVLRVFPSTLSHHSRRLMYLRIAGSDYCVMRFAYALHMCRQNHVPLSCLYTKPCELFIEISITTAPRLPATKSSGSNIHSGADDLSTSMILFARSLVSSFFTPRKSSFLSGDRLNYTMCMVRWFLSITMPSGLQFQKRFS